MTINIPPFFDEVFTDVNNAPLTNGHLNAFYAGTSNPAPTYDDSLALNPVNIPLDIGGRCQMRLDATIVYDIYIYNNVNALVRTKINVSSASGSGDLTAYILKDGHTARTVIGNKAGIAGVVADLPIANDLSSGSVDVIPTVKAVVDALNALPSGDDHKVMVDSGDTTPDYLYNKMVQGDNIVLEVVAGKVVVSAPDIGTVGGTGTAGRTAAWTDTHTLGNAESLTVDTTVTPTVAQGKISWNEEQGTFNLGLKNGVTLQAGEEQLMYIHNENVYTILNGRAVGLTSGSESFLHAKYVDNASASAYDTIAVATQDIGPGEYGYVTKIGLVHDINTIGLTEDAFIYLDSSIGQLTSVKPSFPAHVVQIGRCITSSIGAGVIYVDITVDLAMEDLYNVYTENTPAAEGDTLVREGNRWINRNFGAITHDPTGFANGSGAIVTYDSATRKVTLTGTVEAYFRASLVPALVSGWVSDAHPAGATSTQFLYFDGTDFVWSTTPWTYDQLQIAAVAYNAAGVYQFTVHETHGTMAWQTHQELHQVIGCYNRGGGDLSSYVLNSTTAVNRRPDISTTLLADEDLETLNAVLTSKTYTQYALSGAAVGAFAVAQAEILPVSGNQPYWNQFTTTWVQTLMGNNAYAAIFVYAMPVAADATSQAKRYFFVQPQFSGAETTVDALTTSDLNLDGLANLSPELNAIAKIKIRYTGGNWSIISVSKLTGSRYGMSSVNGVWLSSVTTNTEFTGNGTAAAPLALSGTVLDNLNLTKTTQPVLTIGANASTIPSLYLNGAANSQKGVRFLTAGLSRWNMQSNNGTESGSNAGSNLDITAYDDAGSVIDSPISITRALTGSVTVARDMLLNKITTPSVIVGSPTSTNAQVLLRSTAGTEKAIRFRSGDLGRWAIISNLTAEAGADAGSNLDITAYTDAGAVIDSPISVTRVASGSISLRRNTALTGVLYSNSSNGGIFGYTNDGADNFAATLSSTTAQSPSRGGYIVVKGNEVATNGGDVLIEAGQGVAGDIIMRTGNAERIRITKAGDTYLKSGKTLLPAAGFICCDTADTADNSSIAFCGGGGTSISRGASVTVHGNETLTSGGSVHLVAGDAASVQGDVIVYTGAGVERMRITKAGSVLLNSYRTQLTAYSGATASDYASISLGTTDGADNKRLVLSGGGDIALARGGRIDVWGNEGTTGGDVTLYAGAATGSKLEFVTGSATTAMVIGTAANDIQFKVAESHAIRSVATAGATTTALATDYLVVFTGTLTQTYTLPATGVTARQIIVKNRSTGVVTVNRAGADTIDGGTTFALTTNQSLTLVSNGADWVII